MCSFFRLDFGDEKKRDRDTIDMKPKKEKML